MLTDIPDVEGPRGLERVTHTHTHTADTYIARTCTCARNAWHLHWLGTQCPAGPQPQSHIHTFYPSGVGAPRHCKSCDAGMFSKEGMSQCQHCAPGMFSAYNEANNCLQCKVLSSNAYGRTHALMCVSIHTQALMHTRLHARTHASEHSNMHARTHARTHAHARTRAHTRMQKFIQVHAHQHRTCTRTHAHMHAHRYQPKTGQTSCESCPTEQGMRLWRYCIEDGCHERMDT